MLEYGHHQRVENELQELFFSTQSMNHVAAPLFEPVDTHYTLLCCRASSAHLTARSATKLKACGIDESLVDMQQVVDAINGRTGLSEHAQANNACSVRPITDRLNPAWRSDGSGRGVFNGGSGGEHGGALHPGFVLGVFTGEYLTMSEYKDRARLDPFKYTYCCDMPSTQSVRADVSKKSSSSEDEHVRVEDSSRDAQSGSSSSSSRTVQNNRKETLCVDAANRGNELSRINDFRTNALRPHIPQHPSRPCANCDFLEAELHFDSGSAVSETDSDFPIVVVVPIMVVVKVVPANVELLADYGEAYWASYREVMNRCWSEMGGY
jgi:hypothetical protein